MGVIFTGKNNTNFCIISYDSIIKLPFTIPLTCFCIIICFHDIEIGWIWVCSWYYVCVVFGARNLFAIVRIYH